MVLGSQLGKPSLLKICRGLICRPQNIVMDAGGSVPESIIRDAGDSVGQSIVSDARDSVPWSITRDAGDSVLPSFFPLSVEDPRDTPRWYPGLCVPVTRPLHE